MQEINLTIQPIIEEQTQKDEKNKSSILNLLRSSKTNSQQNPKDEKEKKKQGTKISFNEPKERI